MLFDKKRNASIQNGKLRLKIVKLASLVIAAWLAAWAILVVLKVKPNPVELLLLPMTHGATEPEEKFVRFRDAKPKFKNRVGMMTMYSIVPGGGERYFLTSALAFQSIGFHVEILVKKDNKCLTIDFLKSTAESLRINLNYKKLSLKIVRTDNYLIREGLQNKYDIFYFIGNDKFPQISGIGISLNIYMCQFPFDMEAPGTERLYDVFNTYDIVLVNSLYTFGWYTNLIQPTFKWSRENGHSTPTVLVLYPPVDPFLKQDVLPTNGMGLVSSQYSPKIINIAVLGRFFTGRQNKGQDVAINLLSRLLLEGSTKFHLTLIGSIHPTAEANAFVDELRNNATSRNLPVTFLTNAEPNDIALALSQTTVLWHLTGLSRDNGKPVDDPASLEHFGIAVVEAMSLGCVPIVLNVGGTTDIVEHEKTGFLARNAEDYIAHTLAVASMSDASLARMREDIILKSKQFHVSKFIEKLAVMSQRAMLSHPLRRIVSIFAGKISDTHDAKTIRLIVSPETYSSIEGLHRLVQDSGPNLVNAAVTDSSQTGGGSHLRTTSSILNDATLSYTHVGPRDKRVKQLTLNLNVNSIPTFNFRSLEVGQFPTANTAVIIESSVSSAFEFAVRTTMFHLGPTWGLQVFHSRENSAFVHSVLSDMLNVRFVLMDSPILYVRDYNRIAKSKEFWQSLQSKKVLIFQTDSIVLRSGIDAFIKYDYVGAPWNIASNEKIINLRKLGWLPIPVGNGGFSLRNVDMMIDIIERDGANSPETENEDIFFAKHIQRIRDALVSPVEVAYQFCIEEYIQRNSSSDGMSGSASVSHFALHAAWYYTSPDRVSEQLLGAISPAFKI